MDATGAENHTTLLAITPSTLEKGLIWTGSDDGLVHITRDGGKNWENVSRFPKRINENSHVAQVHASTFNASEAFAVINDYRGDWTPIVLHTDNYGKKWKNILENSDVEGYALSFVQDLIEPNLMFVGTELLVYHHRWR